MNETELNELHKLMANAKSAENDLSNSKLTYNTNLIDRGIHALTDLLGSIFADIYDIETDGINLIMNYDDALDLVQQDVRADIDNAPAVNDLAWLYDHDFFNYVYINGYARITAVTCDDVAGEIDDVLDYIHDNK